MEQQPFWLVANRGRLIDMYKTHIDISAGPKSHIDIFDMIYIDISVDGGYQYLALVLSFVCGAFVTVELERLGH